MNTFGRAYLCHVVKYFLHIVILFQPFYQFTYFLCLCIIQRNSSDGIHSTSALAGVIFFSSSAFCILPKSLKAQRTLKWFPRFRPYLRPFLQAKIDEFEFSSSAFKPSGFNLNTPIFLNWKPHCHCYLKHHLLY